MSDWSLLQCFIEFDWVHKMTAVSVSIAQELRGPELLAHLAGLSHGFHALLDLTIVEPGIFRHTGIASAHHDAPGRPAVQLTKQGVALFTRQVTVCSLGSRVDAQHQPELLLIYGVILVPIGSGEELGGPQPALHHSSFAQSSHSSLDLLVVKSPVPIAIQGLEQFLSIFTAELLWGCARRCGVIRTRVSTALPCARIQRAVVGEALCLVTLCYVAAQQQQHLIFSYGR
mmetsp:Transcript_96292/g.281270  ORF Transcript_96292/g.281270 Transcript_96292/m.281270 type:complete len:229 (+) Transcript_96292:951-1637(+)